MPRIQDLATIIMKKRRMTLRIESSWRRPFMQLSIAVTKGL
jgi:hypothetical protein